MAGAAFLIAALLFPLLTWAVLGVRLADPVGMLALLSGSVALSMESIDAWGPQAWNALGAAVTIAVIGVAAFKRSLDAAPDRRPRGLFVFGKPPAGVDDWLTRPRADTH